MGGGGGGEGGVVSRFKLLILIFFNFAVIRKVNLYSNNLFIAYCCCLSPCSSLPVFGYFVDPPVVVSPPHFYQGNKSLLKTVNGLHPTKSAHETYVDIEPVSKDWFTLTT